MSELPRDLDSLFAAALEIDSAEERAAFIDETCATDDDLRAEVEELLRAHEAAGSFLEQPASAFDATLVPESPDRVAAREAGFGPAFTIDHAVVVNVLVGKLYACFIG